METERVTTAEERSPHWCLEHDCWTSYCTMDDHLRDRVCHYCKGRAGLQVPAIGYRWYGDGGRVPVCAVHA